MVRHGQWRHPADRGLPPNDQVNRRAATAARRTEATCRRVRLNGMLGVGGLVIGLLATLI